MAEGVVFVDAFLEIKSLSGSSVDVSLFMTEARPFFGRDLVEDTAIGDSAHTGVGGLRTDRLEVVLKQGYEAGGPEQTITPIIVANEAVSVEFRPSRLNPVGTTNPRFRIESAVITGDYMPGGGRVGELVSSPLTISPKSGAAWARTTS